MNYRYQPLWLLHLFHSNLNHEIVASGFSDGFCIMDLVCANGGEPQFGCFTMGVSHGCGSITSSGISGQWIDVTTVDDGVYYFWDKIIRPLPINFFSILMN